MLQFVQIVIKVFVVHQRTLKQYGVTFLSVLVSLQVFIQRVIALLSGLAQSTSSLPFGWEQKTNCGLLR